MGNGKPPVGSRKQGENRVEIAAWYAMVMAFCKKEKHG
jgi:hypothetical protein